MLYIIIRVCVCAHMHMEHFVGKQIGGPRISTPRIRCFLVHVIHYLKADMQLVVQYQHFMNQSL